MRDAGSECAALPASSPPGNVSAVRHVEPPRTLKATVLETGPSRLLGATFSGMWGHRCSCSCNFGVPEHFESGPRLMQHDIDVLFTMRHRASAMRNVNFPMIKGAKLHGDAYGDLD